MERGRDANIENHENHFAAIETREGGGWNAGARAARPRDDGQRKTSENANVFHNLVHFPGSAVSSRDPSRGELVPGGGGW